MKVALLLSGLARSVESGYKKTWNHILETYDVDLYLHTWKEEEWEQISKFYPNTKSFILQEPFKFTKYKEGIRLPHNDTSRPIPQYDVMSCFRQFPMFYSWQMGYKPLYDSKIDYDVIIRSRYDLGIHNPINLEIIDMNNVNHSNTGVFFDDNLCITNKKNADKLFKSIFDDVIQYSKEIGILNSAESTWTSMLERYGLKTISVKNPKIGSFDLLRENKLWWGDKDGNILK